MALGGKIVYFIGAHGVDNRNKRRGIAEVGVVQFDGASHVLVSKPGVEVEMLDSSGIERGTAAYQAMYGVAFSQQKLGQIRAVLAGDSCYECCWHIACCL